MKKIGRLLLAARCLHHKLLKAIHRRMNPLVFPACIRIENKSGFPLLFKLPDYKMMNDSVPKISRENLPQFRRSGNKANRAGWPVLSFLNIKRQTEQSIQQIEFKSECIYRTPFPLSTVQICLEYGLERKQRILSPTNNADVVTVVLIVVVVVAVVEVHAPRIVRIVCVGSRRPIKGRNRSPSHLMKNALKHFSTGYRLLNILNPNAKIIL